MIKVMTFNIRNSIAEDGQNCWDNRKDLVIERIRRFAPDILGLQECRDDGQGDFVKKSLPDYEFFARPRGGGDPTEAEMTPVIFSRDRFDLVRSGQFWLSLTPDIPASISWDSAYVRAAAWYELTDKQSGEKLFFVNTHMDYKPLALKESAILLKKWIEETVAGNAVIVTGDFNADRDSAAHKILTEDKLLFDACLQVPRDSDLGTFHDFGRTAQPIDWILTSGHFKTTAVDIDRYHKDDLHPSDHYPLTAALNWKQT